MTHKYCFINRNVCCGIQIAPSLNSTSNKLRNWNNRVMHFHFYCNSLFAAFATTVVGLPTNCVSQPLKAGSLFLTNSYDWCKSEPHLHFTFGTLFNGEAEGFKAEQCWQVVLPGRNSMPEMEHDYVCNHKKNPQSTHFSLSSDSV